MSTSCLILLCLFCCLGNNGTSVANENDFGRGNGRGGRYGSANANDNDCGCRNDAAGTNVSRNGFDRDPFSPLGRQNGEQNYPPFRGNNGPCGCEETEEETEE